MPQTYYKLRGIDVASHIPKWQAMCTIWKHWREPYYQQGDMRNPEVLFIDAMRTLLGPKEWGVSRWTEEHVYDWTHEEFIITWGCASSSKSNDYGLMAMMHWVVDPMDTVVLMASTSRDALLKRTFEATTRYYRLLKNKGVALPGRISSTAKAIIVDTQEGEEGTVFKYGVHGIAIEEGSISKAVGKIRGAHAPQVVLLADELNEMPEAIVDKELLLNLDTGSEHFKFVGLTNIRSFTDLAGLQSVPIGGWKTVNIDTEHWRTLQGVVRRHDGFKSPAIVEPDGDKKFPWLLTKKKLDSYIAKAGGNKEDPSIYRMIRAWPPAVGGFPTAVTEKEALVWGFDSTAKLEWLRWPTPIAALDPGFGGDGCVLQLAWVGILTSGYGMVAFEPEPRVVPIRADDKADVVTKQITDYVIPILRDANVKPLYFAIDDSGPQTVADAFALALGDNTLLRCSFGARASETTVSALDDTVCSDAYANAATENAFLFREYGKFRQLSGLNALAISQLTSRMVVDKGGKRMLEPKPDYKKRTTRGSPDEMDAAGMCLRVAKLRVGFMPGSNEFSPGGPIEAGVTAAAATGFDEAALREVNNFKPSYGGRT